MGLLEKGADCLEKRRKVSYRESGGAVIGLKVGGGGRNGFAAGRRVVVSRGGAAGERREFVVKKEKGTSIEILWLAPVRGGRRA